VDKAEALRVGSELGVEKYQGFFVDQTMRKKAA